MKAIFQLPERNIDLYGNIRLQIDGTTSSQEISVDGSQNNPQLGEQP
ncbi:MAG: hypothetical protein JEZ00_13720 [Anaerolineaceae bacterium]|nr:hypothetical protein [Anaerolineaceae bacterium]